MASARHVSLVFIFVLGALSVAWLGSSREAQACGGCFSPSTAQTDEVVVQDAERVYFHRDEATKLTTVWVEVRYAGAAQDFGWVLPLPKQPKVGTGPRHFFDMLDKRWGQRFETKYLPAENCRSAWDGCLYGEPAAWKDAGASVQDAAVPSGGGTPGNVTVLEQGQTGPYDYSVVKSTDAKVLYEWLNTRGYKTPDKAIPIIESHVLKGDVFVAIKLSNGKGIDLIRPIALEMMDSDPCVPLRLTSIAAQDDMTVAITLTGAGRAVPKNHFNVVINPVRINWFSSPLANNYPQVLAAAIDEAAGHAFVTEFAGPPSDYVLPVGVATNLAQALTKTTNAYDVAEVFAIGNEALPITDETAGIVAKHVDLTKLAPGKSPALVLAMIRACIPFWQTFMGGQPCFVEGVNLDQQDVYAIPANGGALAAELLETFLQPIDDTFKGIKASQKVTRLVMRISPEEMDRDPIFDFSKEMPDVSNVMSAGMGQACSTGWTPSDLTRLEFAGIGSWLVDPTLKSSALDPRFKDAPLALRVELLDATGPAIVMNAADIELVDIAIKGAMPGKASLPAGLTLKPPVAWLAPPVDPAPTTVVVWKKPYDCTPKPGWVDGQLPPGTSGGSDAQSLDVGGVDVAISADGTPSGGGSDVVAAAEVLASDAAMDSGTPTTPAMSGSGDGGGCAASTRSDGLVGLIGVFACALFVMRRRAVVAAHRER